MFTPGTPELRALWDLDPQVTFLNHGSFGAVPRPVQAAQARWRRELEAQPVDFLARRLPALLEGVRARVAMWLNADTEGLAFVANATTGVATVLASMEWHAGDEIVLADQGYNAVRQAVRALEERYGVRAVEVHVPFFGASHDRTVEAFANGLSPRTRLVIVDAVSSPTAYVYPVARVVALARPAGVPVLVDGAHAPGMLPLDLRALGADFFTGNLHKWPCAPRGTAVLYLGERWRTGPARVRPLAVSHGWGGGLAAEFDWTGTVDPTAWLAVPDALDFWDALPGYREVQHQLVREARALLADAMRVELPHPDDPSYYASMAAVPVPLPPPDGAATWTADAAWAVNQRLWEEHRIEVPFTVHEGRLLVRVSGQVYNRGEEYGRLGAVLL